MIFHDEAKERVIQEEAELAERIDKLRIFIGSEKYKELSREMQTLLRLQWSEMHSYQTTLRRRLQIWDR